MVYVSHYIFFADLSEALIDHLGQIELLVEGDGSHPGPLDLELGLSDGALYRIVVRRVGCVEDMLKL